VVLRAVAVAFLDRLAAEDEEAVRSLLAGVELTPADRQHDDRGAEDGWLTVSHGDFLGVRSNMRITNARAKFQVSKPPPN
jgi:hypothetical protein